MKNKAPTGILVIALLAAPFVARAQSTATPVLPGVLVNTGCSPGQTYCWQPYSNTNPLPVSVSGGSGGSQANPSFAQQTAPSYQLLTNANSTGPLLTNLQGGAYLLSDSGTYGGATITYKVTGADGTTLTTFYSDTAGGTQGCVNIGAGSSAQAIVSGGTPSGLYARLAGTASCPSAIGSPGSSPSNLAYTQDTGGASNDAAFQGEVALTVGTPDTQARRSLKANCTASGNVAVTYADASTGTWAAQVGTQTFPIAITQVNTSGTTATCTYANLK